MRVRQASKRAGGAAPWWFLAMSLLSAAGCSLMLDWDEDGQRCTRAGECKGGFSCLGDRCVGDHTLSLWDTCNRTAQCKGGYVCSPYQPRVCSEPCDEYFSPDASQHCPDAQYCAPYRDRETTAEVIKGVCMVSRCAADEDCDDPTKTTDDLDICVAIRPTAGACLPRCQAKVNDSDGTYRDQCAPVAGGPRQACKPLGSGNAERLVCLEMVEPPAKEGELCHPVTNTCDLGMACLNGQCRRYCSLSTQNPCPGYCVPSAARDPLDPSKPLYAYCSGP